MSVNKIVVNGKEFTDDAKLNQDLGLTIRECNLFLSTSLSCDELSVDTLDASLNCAGYLYTYFRPKGSTCLLDRNKALFCVRPKTVILTEDMSNYAYGTPVQYYRDNNLFATLYMSSVKRVGKYVFAISCISGIGLLDSSTHYGGIYTGQSVPSVVSEIIGGIIPFTVASAFNDMHVYGWLPIATRRENLHQLLFAEGGVAITAANGTLQISTLATSNPRNIPNSRLYTGGSMELPGEVTHADITEHAYIASPITEEKSVFEGMISPENITAPSGAARQGTLITFNEPYHSLRIEGASILESAANYAVVGNGISCILYGKPYVHNMRIVTRDRAQTRAVGSVQNHTATVDSATLVNLANVENVADRVYNYYSVARTVNNDMVYNASSPTLPGAYVSLYDPFDAYTTGYVQSLDVNVSNTLKATAKITANYRPALPGDYYTHTTVITSNTTWTVPSGCKGKIRVILGGGGQGGSSGCKGSQGKVVSSFTGEFGGLVRRTISGYGCGIAGEGGAGGYGGQGGKIAQVTLNVSVGQSFAVHIGAGGAGGSYSGDYTAGSLGGATTFGSYSSDSGAASAAGFIDQTTGARYSTPGIGGISGGRGTGGKYDPANCDKGVGALILGDSITDEDGKVWSVGSTKTADYAVEGEKPAAYIIKAEANQDDIRDGALAAFASYALGGGAAGGSNGASVTSIKGTVTAEMQGLSNPVPVGGAVGTQGMNGATPSKTPKKQTIRGGGGRGGYGGGGAGGHGLAYTAIVNPANAQVVGGVVGKGGNGGKGGDGGDGYVIIYW